MQFYILKKNEAVGGRWMSCGVMCRKQHKHWNGENVLLLKHFSLLSSGCWCERAVTLTTCNGNNGSFVIWVSRSIRAPFAPNSVSSTEMHAFCSCTSTITVQATGKTNSRLTNKQLQLKINEHQSAAIAHEQLTAKQTNEQTKPKKKIYTIKYGDKM